MRIRVTAMVWMARFALIAADGEWTRRRIPNVETVRRFGGQLGVPVRDVATDGYPDKMRETSVENIARPS